MFSDYDALIKKVNYTLQRENQRQEQSLDPQIGIPPIRWKEMGDLVINPVTTETFLNDDELLNSIAWNESHNYKGTFDNVSFLSAIPKSVTFADDLSVGIKNMLTGGWFVGYISSELLHSASPLAYNIVDENRKKESVVVQLLNSTMGGDVWSTRPSLTLLASRLAQDALQEMLEFTHNNRLLGSKKGFMQKVNEKDIFNLNFTYLTIGRGIYLSHVQ